MRIAQIKSCLDSYDGNKGTGRIFKDEPHIGELRQFYNNELEGKDRELTSLELVKVVRICLRKNTWNDSESSIALGNLLAHLGGKNALQRLKKNKQLAGSYIFLLEKYKDFADNLSRLMETLKGYSLDAPLSEIVQGINDLANIDEKLKDIELLKQTCFLSSRTLQLTANNKASCAMASTIILLRQLDIAEEELDCLPTQYMSSVHQILVLLQHPELIKANLLRVCKLGNDTIGFLEILKELTLLKESVTQANLDKCFHPDVVASSAWIKEIIDIFKEAKWPVEPHLDSLFKNAIVQIYHIKVSLALETLKRLKLPLLQVQSLLHILFNNPQHSVNLIEAVDILVKNNLCTSFNLATIIISDPQYATKLANAIRIANTVSLDNEENKKLFTTVPAVADSMALLFTQLEKAQQFSPEIRELALKQSQNAEVAASVVRYLRKNEIFTKEFTNLSIEKNHLCAELFKKNLMNLEFLDLLAELAAAEILSPDNITKLIENFAFIRTLTSACFCLSYGKKLDQDNFDLLFCDPKHALNMAEALGGKTKPPATEACDKQIADKGAQDFVAIRKAAQILAQGMRGTKPIFASVKPNAKQVELLARLLKKDLMEFDLDFQQEQHKAILIKIAQMCGNGQLESITEYNAAYDGFNFK
ncbi:hypothetical protein [Legionella cardiaca]|uniref:Uncharacterized protein n=1 Tax=Legionella cardiaca TaxID=1071983 RepID=A0ABY8ATP7_9GAMM|nr:hypothetical protein [Legionella cardiaca]WED43928.1 hypothetical protein PXX05_03855 [Legionella cardiaca]